MIYLVLNIFSFYINITKTIMNLTELINTKLHKLNNIKIQNNKNITDEYNNENINITFLIKFQNKYIFIFNKYESPKLKDIKLFINSINYIINIINKEIILCLFVSKTNMTQKGKELFEIQNNKNFHYLSNNKSIEILSNEVFQYIKNLIESLNPNKKVEKIQIMKLYKHQLDTINYFSDMFLETKITKIIKSLLFKKTINKINSGIISLPTGTGKQIIALSIIGKFWNKFPNKSVLWITKRKDVLQSQFDNKSKLNIAINSGFIQNLDFFKLLCWYNTSIDIELLNNELLNDKPILLIINIDNIIYDQRYQLFNKNKFGLIILDESHCAGAPCIFNMLNFFLKKWINLTGLIGFTATPVRNDILKLQNTIKLFGYNDKINFINKMTIMDAIDNNIIVPPSFLWFENYINNNIYYDDFLIKNKNIEYINILKNIEFLLNKSITKKAIAWTKTIHNADQWKLIIQHTQQFNKKFPILSKLKIFISHTQINNDNNIKDFLKQDDFSLIICIGRLIEGFDDPKVDCLINLDSVKSKNKSIVLFIQKIGRSLRYFRYIKSY